MDCTVTCSSGTQPTAATRDRYIHALQAILQFSEAKALAAELRAGQVNVTYVPVRALPATITPDALLDPAYYDYARAEALLTRIPKESRTQGPYIVSTAFPLTTAEPVTSQYLFQDLSSVPSEIVVLWVQEFVKQSTQPDFWRERLGSQVVLRLRTGIALLASGIDPAKKSAGEWQGILSTLLFWKTDEQKPENH